MKHLGDITKLKGSEVPLTEIVVGGSPCQDLSVAGKRAGLAGARSGLFMEQIRLIKEMRENDRKNGRTDEHIRPRYMVWENVPGAFSSNKGEDFRCVLEETAKVAERDAVIPGPPKGKWSKSGAIMGDGWSIAWRVHDAQFWGVPQRRKRIALVADFGGESAPEILFERKGMSGDITESGKEGEGAASDAGAGTEETGRCLNGWDIQSKHIQPENGIAESLYAGECRGGGGESYVMQSSTVGVLNDQGGSVMNVSEDVTGALRAQEHGHQPIVYGISAYDSNAMKSSNPNSGIYQAETARTLDLNGGSPACNQGGMAVVCLEGNGSRPSHKGDGYAESETMYTLNSTEHHAVAVENHPNDSRVKISEDGMAQTLSSRMGTGGGNVPMVMELYQNTTGTLSPGAHAGSYNGQDAYNDMLISAPVVRRLTPLECERLQGYPDGWTDIGEWYDSKGKKHKDADSPRYKALGNSIALPFWQWMAERMVRVLKNEQSEKEPTMASLFSGIGGFELVFARAGCKPVWNSEIESYPEAVTRVHFGDDERGIKGDYEQYL